MDDQAMKKMILGTVAGGITFFVLGGLIYEAALGGFYETNVGSAIDAWREPPIWWSLVVSQFALAAAVTFLFVRADVASAMEGMKTGAAFGLLLGAAVAFDLYGVTNLPNETVTFVEPFVWAVRTALAGGVIAWALGMSGAGSPLPAGE